MRYDYHRFHLNLSMLTFWWNFLFLSTYIHALCKCFLQKTFRWSPPLIQLSLNMQMLSALERRLVNINHSYSQQKTYDKWSFSTHVQCTLVIKSVQSQSAVSCYLTKPKKKLVLMLTKQHKNRLTKYRIHRSISMNYGIWDACILMLWNICYTCSLTC